MLLHQGVENALLSLHLHLAGHLSHLPLGIGLSPDDVELAAAAAALRVDFVTQARRAQRSPLVEKRRVEFRGKRVAGIPAAKGFARGRALALRVAALDHKVLDNPVEKGSVIEALAGQFKEIVTVCRSLVIQTHGNVAKRRGYLYFCHINFSNRTNIAYI